MPEKRGNDRRKTDVDLTEIKVFMQEINDYMKYTKPAVDQTWTNKDDITTMKIEDIAPMKVKQKFIIWIGGIGFIALISNFVRKLF